MVVVCISIMTFGFSAWAEDVGDSKTLVISGAGPSTKVVELLAKEFVEAHEGYRIIVPPKSIKHKGGLEWATVRGKLFGRTGRPLSDKDRESYPTAVELPIAQVKLSFAVHKDLGVTELTLEQWKKTYEGVIRNWKELGGRDKPIMLLGREKGEAGLSAICKIYPFLGECAFKKVYRKEHKMIDAIDGIPGAIGFSTEQNLSARPELRVLKIEGFSCGLRVGLVYDVKNEDTETVKLMKAFIHSEPWRKAIEENGFLSPESKT
jgi:phosphate transport system substrate-binding protein